jgi:hypothetical protein
MGLSLISCGVQFTTVPDSPNVKTRYYQKDGSYSGYSIKSESGVTRYYDRSGKYIGKSTER